MPQVIKPEVRERILREAARLFARHRYAAVTIPQIARAAGLSQGAIYVYFDSKLAVLFGVYEPWLRARLDQVEKRLARARTPRAKLRLILSALWREIPGEQNGFAGLIVQGLSGAAGRDAYQPALLAWAEGALKRMLAEALSPAAFSRRQLDALVHLAFMAYDGFVATWRINPGARCTPAFIESICDLVLAAPATGIRAPVPGAPRRRGAGARSRNR